MDDSKRQLAKFLKEVSGWDWWDFLQAEKDPKYTTRQSIVFAMVRAAAMENLPAIATAISRLDGKVETPVQVVMPKVYYLYPNATEVEKLPEPESAPGSAVAVIEAPDMADELPTQSFRETMRRMAGLERTLPDRIIKCQEAWEAYANGRGQAPMEGGVPQTVKVSSVVAARLLNMAQKRNLKALDEVFDQLDGKLVETVRIVGEDMYLVQWGTVAPAGAVKNEDGIYQVEVPQMSRMWGERLDPSRRNLPVTIIEEGK